MSETYRVGETRYTPAAPARRRRRTPAQPVVTIQVDARLWDAAVRQADGDPSRLVIVDPVTVLILNQPRTPTQVRKFLGRSRS